MVLPMFGGIPVQEIDALSKYWEALPAFVRRCLRPTMAIALGWRART